MNTLNLKWLRLELKNEEALSSRYSIIHTQFARYSYLIEEGYILGVFNASNYEKDIPHGVMYIQTDSPEFYQACISNYSNDFHVSELTPFFSLPTNYRLALGVSVTFKNQHSA
ncbi:hypothetical protein [Owenweeksia hongkongensis]|uniref:hypothetical protein n=1 Tax=Owenweeksia hongkongensis TaxID=253245 RepID=UPI003A922B70